MSPVIAHTNNTIIIHGILDIVLHGMFGIILPLNGILLET